MPRAFTMAGLLLAVLAVSVSVAPAGPPRADDEQAIRRAGQAFVETYGAKDAKRLAALFTADAEIVDDHANSAQGQQAIEQVFAGIFRAHPKSKIEVKLRSIRFVDASVAMEDGTSRVTGELGQTLERNRYTVVYVKQDGTWRMASARDLPAAESSASEELAELAWLIGDWVDEGQSAVIATSYRWSDNHDFILSEFSVHVAGRRAMTGSQRIGWDPLTKKIRCWVFDSEGGFAEGAWTRQGNQWIAKMAGVTRDGKPASSTNITARVAKDRLTWQSRDRAVGDQVLPDIEKISVVRKPPEPRRVPHANQPSTGGSR
jgi:uncharacterized protein (TIGR02246 family)